MISSQCQGALVYLQVELTGEMNMMQLRAFPWPHAFWDRGRVTFLVHPGRYYHTVLSPRWFGQCIIMRKLAKLNLEQWCCGRLHELGENENTGFKPLPSVLISEPQVEFMSDVSHLSLTRS